MQEWMLYTMWMSNWDRQKWNSITANLLSCLYIFSLLIVWTIFLFFLESPGLYKQLASESKIWFSYYWRTRWRDTEDIASEDKNYAKYLESTSETKLVNVWHIQKPWKVYVQAAARICQQYSSGYCHAQWKARMIQNSISLKHIVSSY